MSSAPALGHDKDFARSEVDGCCSHCTILMFMMIPCCLMFAMAARRRVGATRQGWSEGSERCDDFTKFGSSSSGCEPRPAKGEPAQPVASLAASKETTAPMRRRASMWAVGNAATKTMSSRVPRGSISSKATAVSPQQGRGETAPGGVYDHVSFFDSLDRTKLKELLQIRVVDGSLLRFIGKCLHVGVLDGAEYAEPDTGTAQGSVLSPMLGNVHLHCVLDLWFEREVKPRLRGEAHIVRYADDFVMTFERQDDAERVMDVLGKRMGRFGLTLHPDKTRLLPFRRPPAAQTSGKGPATFDFLGFTLHDERARSGRWGMMCKTRHARLRRSIQAIADWCRRHRHQPVKVQHAALTMRIQGHFNYFGVSGNFRSLLMLVEETKWVWFKWLRRRSQRAHLTWEGFGELLKRFPLPRPRIAVRVWGP
ncbi:MAG: hypothetical protein KF718_25665 [Polyangiaceae bacterium]|nr:hypothetical protein [Polyangiaceae bacterium]